MSRGVPKFNDTNGVLNYGTEAQKYFKSGAFNCTDVLKRRQKCWKSSEVLLIGLQLAPCFLL